jgi:hypothetical protein
MKRRSVIALLFAVAMGAASPAPADMGRIQVATENVQVSEDAQKAIILHNGKEEILILGTDLKATGKTGIIRFIPFPSAPEISLAPAGAFEQAAAIIRKYGLVFQTWIISKGGEASASTDGIELRFSQKLGAHDLTLIKVNEVATFRQWVNDYFRQRGLPAKESYPEEESVVSDYIQRGIVYFVLDYVELDDTPRFIDPVLYHFNSRDLYYPLKTTNTFGGEGTVELVIIAPTTLCSSGHYEYLEQGSQALYTSGPCLGLPTTLASTSARIVHEEEDIRGLSPQGEAFFGGRNAFIQVIRYQGKYHFDEDVFIDVSKGLPKAFGVMEEEEGHGLWPSELTLGLGCMRFTNSLEQRKCRLQPDRGPCKGNFTRYYFDLQSRQCRPFSWGGCGGVVPFQTEQECRTYADPPLPK